MDNINNGLARHYSVCVCLAGFELFGLGQESPFIPQFQVARRTAQYSYVRLGGSLLSALFE
ncbi:MAG: hypothetical protein KKC58_12860 [Gammaproteobacteria bacterium]|nr:hypothetical protein [Gammaproteobacteria bacterium]